jgi:uncharacterized membrane protein
MESNNHTRLIPEVGSAFGFGWQKMKDDFANLLVVTIIMLVAQSLGSISGTNTGNDISYSGSSVSFLIWLLISGPVSMSATWVYLKAVRGDSYEIKDTVACFGSNYFEIMLAGLLVTFIIIFGIVFLIVPGIVFAVKLAFVPYLVMDKEMKATDAIKKSWEMTKGYGWQLFFMGFLSIFIVIAGLLLFIVGIFPAILWVNSAFAAFYHAVDLKNKEAVTIETIK